MKPKATRTKFFTAYTEGKPTFKKRGESGVYLIYSKDKELKYIGYSETDVYKSLYRHFQSWKDKTQQRFTYPHNSLIRIILTTPHRAHLLEKFLITRFNPVDALIKYKDYLTPSEEKTVEKISEAIEPVTSDEWKDYSDVPF